jgi:PHD/YefM family antitoxin component YafN of YafNO toxin-antitoxin module
MSQITTVSATEFARNFAHYQRQAIEEKVVVVTSHDKVVGGYLSASELEHYQRLRAGERKVHIVGELPDYVVAAIQAAEYGVAPK